MSCPCAQLEPYEADLACPIHGTPATCIRFALDALNKYETTGDDAYLSEARGYLEDTAAPVHEGVGAVTPASAPPSETIIVSLTREEAEDWIRDSRSLDAHVLVRSRGGVKPSGRRASTRAKLAEALRNG